MYISNIIHVDIVRQILEYLKKRTLNHWQSHKANNNRLNSRQVSKTVLTIHLSFVKKWISDLTQPQKLAQEVRIVQDNIPILPTTTDVGLNKF